jgi:branched-chain amino acid aminotransferase
MTETNRATTKRPDDELLVYVNGEFKPAAEASVSVFSWGFLYGDGVFQGLAVKEGRCFGFESHMDRFFQSAAYMAIVPPVSRDECEAIIAETARINDLYEGYLRPLFTRGVGRMGLRNVQSLGGGEFFVIPQHERAYTVEEVKANLHRAKTVSVRRIPPASIDARAKLCNYQNNILAVIEHRAAGADTGIMLDVHGFVAEGPAENIFVVKDGEVSTPPRHNVLNGVTRAAIIEVARAQDRLVRERDLTVYDLYNADEVFFTGSLHGIGPVAEIDGRRIGSGEIGDVSLELLLGYRALEEAESFELIGRPDA